MSGVAEARFSLLKILLIIKNNPVSLLRNGIELLRANQYVFFSCLAQGFVLIRYLDLNGVQKIEVG
jgi:hypothetical protein